MKLTISQEDIIASLTPPLRDKLAHSINLLSKAEKIALRYDPEGYILAFSGGKDSQALYHVAQLSGVHFRAQMNLTSVDPPEVIRFIRQHYPEVHMIPPSESIFSVAVRKKLVPTMRFRWCCHEFKENKTAGKVTLVGVRNEESTRRADRKEFEISKKHFSGDFEQLEQYQQSLQTKKYIRKGRLRKSENGEYSVDCIYGKETLTISPIIHWTESEVWEFLTAIRVPHCCLYDQGFHRIGCILCPMLTPKVKQLEMKRYPHVRRNWIKAIHQIRQAGGMRAYQWTPRPDDDEDTICEAAFDWWMSQKSYQAWYQQKYAPQLPFEDED